MGWLYCPLHAYCLICMLMNGISEEGSWTQHCCMSLSRAVGRQEQWECASDAVCVCCLYFCRCRYSRPRSHNAAVPIALFGSLLLRSHLAICRQRSLYPASCSGTVLPCSSFVPLRDRNLYSASFARGSSLGFLIFSPTLPLIPARPRPHRVSAIIYFVCPLLSPHAAQNCPQRAGMGHQI